jgi:hypothetical protein
MFVRASRFLLEVIAVAALGIIILAGFSVWRLMQGPVPLDFLSPHIEQAFNSQGGPLRIKVQQTSLAWAGWDRRLDIRVSGVQAIGAGGRVIARVPELSMGFSGKALLRGVIAPASVDLIGLGIRLERNEQGALSIAVDEVGNVEGDLIGNLIGAFQAGGSSDQPESRLDFLNRVAILGARLVIDDKSTGVTWGAPNVDLVLVRQSGEIQASLFADLNIGKSTAQVSGNAVWRSGQDAAQAELRFSDVQIDKIAAVVPALKQLEALHLGVGGTVNLEIGLDGALRSAVFNIETGQGRIVDRKGWPSGLPVTSLSFSGKYESDVEALEISRLNADLGGPKLEAVVSIIRLGDTYSINGRSRIDAIKIPELARYWPVGAVDTARSWVVGNITGGQVEDLRMAVSLRTPAEGGGKVTTDSFTGSLRFHNGKITYLKGLPPLEKVEGTAVFGVDRFIASISSGETAGLALSDGDVRLTALDGDSEQAVITATIAGSLSDSLSIIDRKPLEFVSRFGIDAKSVTGQANTSLTLNFPLSTKLEPGDIKVVTSSRITNATVPNVVMGRAFTQGDLMLKVDRSKLTLDGDARLVDVPVKIHWTERFDRTERFVRRYGVRAVFDQAARAKLGLPALAPYVTGPLGMELAYLKPLDGNVEMVIKLDLDKSALWLPGFEWRKAPGKVGVAWFSVSVDERARASVQEFDIRTQGFRAKGSASFGSDNSFKSLQISDFKLGRTRLGGTVALRRGGGYDVVLQGLSLDAAALMESGGDEKSVSGLPPIHLKADFRRVWIGGDTPIDNFRGDIDIFDDRWRRASFTGQVGEMQKLKYSITPNRTGRTVTFVSSDAGGTMAAFDVLNTMEGGKLVLKATTKDTADAVWAGRLTISDFMMVKAPLLARLLTFTSLTGIVNTLSGKGIGFAQLDIPFSYRQGVVKIDNARAVGSQLGLTANGVIDSTASTLDIKGTVIPAYTLNTMLGKIPLLGRILTGEKGSGVFAATYRVRGTLAKPEISANPLAALAPGFLRNFLDIFSAKDPVEFNDNDNRQQ